MNILSYTHDITILLKGLCSGIINLKLTLFAPNNLLVTFCGSQAVKVSLYRFSIVFYIDLHHICNDKFIATRENWR